MRRLAWCCATLAAVLGGLLLGTAGRNDDPVTLCHHPDKAQGHTLTVDNNAVPAHLAHGDELGACPVSGSH